MDSGRREQVEAGSSNALKSNENFNHDTKMLGAHAKAINKAVNVMKEEQTNIERKRQKRKSKELPTCIDNYNRSLKSLIDTLKQAGDLVTDGGFADKKDERHNISMTDPRRKMQQETQCLRCFNKDVKIKQLQENLNRLQQVRRSRDELQQKYDYEIKNRKKEDMYHQERSEKEYILQSDQMRHMERHNKSSTWNAPRKEMKRPRAVDTFDDVNTECMTCYNKDTKIRKLEDDLKRTRDDFGKANQKIAEFEWKLKQQEDMLNEYSQANEKLQQQNQTETQQRERYEHMYQEEKAAKDDPFRRLNEYRQANEELQQQNQTEIQQRERYERMYQEEKAAKDDAFRRLSLSAYSKLRDNNPPITDLSDQNRPTKIAEKMSELYDNQWTDAYDALERQRLGERQIIQTLLETLMDVYRECSSLAKENFFERVQRSIEIPIPIEVVKKRIRIAHQHIQTIQMYINHCIEIGWFCAVQDPPLVLMAQASEQFDTNTFKEYTKRGKYTEFVVWPALYLHDGGALLAKGVAQGSDHARPSINNTPRSTPIGTLRKTCSPPAVKTTKVQASW